MASRLALGTVQFGIPYGISNTGGQVPRDAAAAILDAAADAGIDTLDTASADGDSEAVLGDIGVSRFRVFTKLPPLTGDIADPAGWVEREVAASLDRLKRDRLDGLMLHRSGDLERPGGEAIHAAIVSLREQGTIGRIGYSIYEPAELDRLFERFAPDVIQAPFNVFDRRLARSGWLDRLSWAGVEVHTRSAFLQGLLLMPQRPASFAPFADRFAAWDEAHGGAPLATALGFTLSMPAIARVVVGVTSVDELAEIVAAQEAPHRRVPDALASDDEALVNPSRWSR